MSGDTKPEEESRDVAISVDEFEAEIRSWEGSPCWGLYHYLGSMLSFDLDGRMEVPLRRGRVVTVGTRMLSIYDVFWVFDLNKDDAIDSDEVDKKSFRRIHDAVVGSRIESIAVKQSEAWLDIKFSSGARIGIDLTNRHEAEGVVVGFSENHAYKFIVDPDGTFRRRVHE